MAKQFNNIDSSTEFDEFDVLMSQLETNVFVVGENAEFPEEDSDEMDEIMSQIDTESLYEQQLDTNVFVVGENTEFKEERLDEMDEIMSQIDTESLNEPEEKVDTDEAGVPQELLDRFEQAMNGIEDDLILQMEEEADPDIELDLSPELLREYEKAMNAILPKKSSDRYLQAYDVFRKWQTSHCTTSLDEKVVMAYFSEASAKYKPSTLWRCIRCSKKLCSSSTTWT